MSAPIFLWISTFLFSLIGFNKKIHTGVVIFWILLLTIGFRVDTIDYNNYLTIYRIIDNIEYNQFEWFVDVYNDKIEWGYASLILFSKQFYVSFFFFVFVYYLITLLLKFYIFFKISSNFYLTLFTYISLGYYTMDMGTMRMGLATTIMMLVVIFIQEKKIINFFITIIIASSIHIISIIGLPLYFISYIESQVNWMLLFVLSILISILGGAGKFIGVVFALILGEGNFISESLYRYAISEKFEGIKLFGGTYILLIISAIIIIIFRRKLEKVNIYNKIIIKIFLFGIIFTIAFYDFGILSFRIKDMLVIPTLVVLLPSFISIFKQKFIVSFILLIYCIVFFLAFGSLNMPYSNFLFI